MQSESIGQLVAALCKARAEFAPAIKDKINPHYKSRYVDLDNAVSAVFPALVSNGLFVMQMFNGDTLETLLGHESGEWIKGSQNLHGKLDPQGIAGASTYARRYGLLGMLGVAPEDDDGNAAQKNFQEQQAQLEKEVPLFVTGVQKKEKGEKNFWEVSFSNGGMASTFSSTLSGIAEKAQKDKRAVTIKIEPKEYNGRTFYTLEGIV